MYYDIVKTNYNGKNYYTLIGFDNNSVMSNKKWIEVMTFDQKNEPVFGGQYFNYQQDSLKRATQYRYSLEYKKEARAILKYDEDSKLIIVDHLISETDEPDNKWTYVPDGDYTPGGDQASAGAQSSSPRSCIPSKAAVTLPLSRSMQRERAGSSAHECSPSREAVGKRFGGVDIANGDESWPQRSRSAVTPRAEPAGSLEVSTVATGEAGFTRRPRVEGHCGTQ